MRAEDILVLLEEHGPLKTDDLVEKSGEKKSVIANHTKTLRQMKLITVQTIPTSHGYSFAIYSAVPDALAKYRQTMAYKTEEKEIRLWRKEVSTKLENQKNITKRALTDRESIFSGHLWASIVKANKKGIPA